MGVCVGFGDTVPWFSAAGVSWEERDSLDSSICGWFRREDTVDENGDSTDDDIDDASTDGDIWDTVELKTLGEAGIPNGDDNSLADVEAKSDGDTFELRGDATCVFTGVRNEGSVRILSALALKGLSWDGGGEIGTMAGTDSDARGDMARSAGMEERLDAK